MKNNCVFKRSRKQRKQKCKGNWRKNMLYDSSKRFKILKINSRQFNRSSKNWRQKKKGWRSWHSYMTMKSSARNRRE